MEIGYTNSSQVFLESAINDLNELLHSPVLSIENPGPSAVGSVQTVGAEYEIPLNSTMRNSLSIPDISSSASVVASHLPAKSNHANLSFSTSLDSMNPNISTFAGSTTLLVGKALADSLKSQAEHTVVEGHYKTQNEQNFTNSETKNLSVSSRESMRQIVDNKDEQESGDANNGIVPPDESIFNKFRAKGLTMDEKVIHRVMELQELANRILTISKMADFETILKSTETLPENEVLVQDCSDDVDTLAEDVKSLEAILKTRLEESRDGMESLKGQLQEGMESIKKWCAKSISLHTSVSAEQVIRTETEEKFLQCSHSINSANKELNMLECNMDTLREEIAQAKKGIEKYEKRLMELSNQVDLQLPATLSPEDRVAKIEEQVMKLNQKLQLQEVLSPLLVKTVSAEFAIFHYHYDQLALEICVDNLKLVGSRTVKVTPRMIRLQEAIADCINRNHCVSISDISNAIKEVLSVDGASQLDSIPFNISDKNFTESNGVVNTVA